MQISCTVLNRATGETITDLSEENIKRLFDVEYGKTPVNQVWVEKINLSELAPNTIYKYIVTSTVQIPQIKNDTANDITLITKDSAFNMDTVETVTIEAGRIYGFSWMIDSVTIK